MKKYFKIGEISKLYNIGVDSLRYYEELGLISPERSEKGYRLYSISDIWKLNVIREMRGLNFGMEEIKKYLDCHTVDKTLELLDDEEKAIDDLMSYLKGLRRNLKRRRDILNYSKKIVEGRVTLCEFPKRNCFSLNEPYKRPEEMDVLIKKLLNIDKSRFYVIGNNQIGTVLGFDDGKIYYKSVFIIDSKGNDSLPAGKYLSVCYKGDYSQSEHYSKMLFDYAKENGLEVSSDVLEILWVDIHTSEDKSEHVTELQLRVL